MRIERKYVFFIIGLLIGLSIEFAASALQLIDYLF